MTDAERPVRKHESRPSSPNPEVAQGPPSEEKILDEGAVSSVSGILHQMRVALQNIRLYPEGSPQALRAASLVFAPISRLLEERGDVTFGVKEDKFLVNGALYKPSDDQASTAGGRFAKMLSDSGISSMTFKCGITVEELGAFLDSFSRKKWSQENIREVTRGLRERGVTHIALSEQVYVAVDETSLVFVVEKGEGLSDQSGAAREKILRILRDMTSAMGEIQDENVREQTKVEIARRIIELDPALISKLLAEDKGIPRGKDEEKPQSQVAGFAQEEMTEIMGDFARLYHDLDRAVSEDLHVTSKELDQMRAIVNRLLSLCQDQGEAMAMYKKLIESEAFDLIPAWIEAGRQEQESPAAAKAEELLQKDALFLLREDQRESVDAMVREMKIRPQGDVIANLMAQLLQGLRARTPDIRLKAVRRIIELQGTLDAISDRDLVREVDDGVIAMMDLESDYQVYQEGGFLLDQIVSRAIVGKDYGRIANVIVLLRRHIMDVEKGFAARAREAGNIIARLAHRDTIRPVVAELSAQHKQQREAARYLLIQFGQEGLPALLTELKETRERSERFALADVIKTMGRAAVVGLMAEALKEESASVVVRLLDVATRVGHKDDVLETLGSMLQRPDPEIRLAVVRTIQHIGGEKAEELACVAMCDSSPYVVVEAIKIAEENPSEKAVGILIGLVHGWPALSRGERANVQEAACRALGVIGDTRAVPYLIQLAGKPTLVQRLLKKGYPSQARCAAARALAKFRQYPEVNDALQLLLRDGDAHVRETAERVLAAPP